MSQDGAQPGNEQWRWDSAGNPLDRHSAAHVMHNRVTGLNGIRWQYDIHGRTTEKDDGHTRWRYRYDGEHRLTDVISEPRDRNKPRTKVSFRYDPLGRRISKTSQQLLQGRPSGNAVTTRFVWEGYPNIDVYENTVIKKGRYFMPTILMESSYLLPWSNKIPLKWHDPPFVSRMRSSRRAFVVGEWTSEKK